MTDKLCRIQVRHLRSVLEALRLIDLDELATCAEKHGTAADREFIAAVRRALDTLPKDSHL